jgi:hypothetical protein
MNYAFIQRLLMYDAQRKGDSLATYQADLAQLHSDTHIPEGFEIQEAINTLASYHRRELGQIDELWLADVDLEWSGIPSPVEDVSTPIADAHGIDCVVCRDPLTLPGVQTVCNHSYCKDCLQSWIHACVPASHTCPICRHQLFERPDYKPKEPVAAMNYRLERDRFVKELEFVLTIDKVL